jgi:hypothetical protein
VDRPAQLAIRSFVSALVVDEMLRTTNAENKKSERKLEVAWVSRDPLSSKGLSSAFRIDVCTRLRGRILDYNHPIMLHLAVQKNPNSLPKSRCSRLCESCSSWYDVEVPALTRSGAILSAWHAIAGILSRSGLSCRWRMTRQDPLTSLNTNPEARP